MIVLNPQNKQTHRFNICTSLPLYAINTVVDTFEALLLHVSLKDIDEHPNSSNGLVTIKDPTVAIPRTISVLSTCQMSILFCPGKKQLKQGTLLH